MQIRWSTEAGDDLERIVLRIQSHNPEAARRVGRTIYEGIGLLRDFPLRGRIGRMDGTRELVFTPLPYIAVYRVTQGVIEIGRIHHGAQDRP